MRRGTRRPVEERILLVHRTRPELLRPWLPEDALPLTAAGFALALVCYTRRRPARVERLLPGHLRQLRPRRREELSLHLPREGPGPWRLPLAAQGQGSPTFVHEGTALGVSLTVRSEGNELLHLRAEARGLPTGSVFSSARDAAAYLRAAPAAEDLDLPETRTWEPLEVLDLRAPLLEELLPEGELDSAFRMVARRTLPVQERHGEGPRTAPAATPLPSS